MDRRSREALKFWQSFPPVYRQCATIDGVLPHPHKKPQKKGMTEQQKLENQTMASERIIVEQSISGLMRYRILSEKLRTQLLDFYNKIIEICAGLWNFYLSSHFFITH